MKRGYERTIAILLAVCALGIGGTAVVYAKKNASERKWQSLYQLAGKLVDAGFNGEYTFLKNVIKRHKYEVEIEKVMARYGVLDAMSYVGKKKNEVKPNFMQISWSKLKKRSTTSAKAYAKNALAEIMELLYSVETAEEVMSSQVRKRGQFFMLYSCDCDVDKRMLDVFYNQ